MDSHLGDVLTIDEVAAYLRIPVSSVYRLAQENRIPAQKVGRHWRFYKPTLDLWLLSGCTQSDQIDDEQDEHYGEIRDFS